MRSRVLSLVALAFALVGIAAAYNPHAQITESAIIVLENLLIVDPVTGTTTPGTLYINNGFIISTNILPSTGAFKVDLTNATVLDFKNSFYAVPGFVSIEASMTFRNPLAAPTATTVGSSAADPNDFTTVANMPQQERFSTVYQPILQSSLQSGITTWVDQVSNPEDFKQFRDVFVGHNVISYPNLYSMGPWIVPPNTPAVAAWVSAGWAMSFSNIASLNNTFRTWFDSNSYDLLGALVAGEVLTDDRTGVSGALGSTDVTSIVQAIRSYPGRIAGFVSFRDANVQAAANAGAQLKFGVPLDYPLQSCTAKSSCCQGTGTYNAMQCAMLSSPSITALSSNGVTITTTLSAAGGSLVYFLTPFLQQTYPNPAAPIYQKRGYYQLGMPANIKANYEKAFQLAANNGGGGAAAAANVLNAALGVALQLQIINATYAQYPIGGAGGFVLSAGAGYPWAIHGFLPLEALYASATTPFDDNRKQLYGITYGAARAVGLHGKVGRLWPGMYGDVIIMTRNPLTTSPAVWADSITTVFKFGFKQPDVDVMYIYGVAMALAAVGFGLLLTILFISYTICCSRIAERAKRGEVTQSMLA